MERSEAAQVLAIVIAVWPRFEQPANAPAVWAEILGAVEADDAQEAVKDWIAEGHAFPPSASEVLARITERATEVPEWDEALAEIERAVMRYRPPREAITDEWSLHAGPPDEYWSHPVIALFMQGNVWREWKMVREGDRLTFLAQQRNAYKAFASRTSRDLGLALIGAPRRSTLRGGGLRRLDVAALLPGAPDDRKQLSTGA